MTGDQFSEVDVDLLADYVGGALEGTPDQAAVAERIAGDPSWRAAYDEVNSAMATVGSQLSALGGSPEPMPADVAARLDAALTEAPSPLRVLPGGNRSVPARRRPRWTAAVAVAAAVVVFAGVGSGFWVNRNQSSNDSSQSTAAAGSAEDKAVPLRAPSVALPPADKIQSSGTDYDRTTLGRVTPRAQKDGAPPAEGPSPSIGLADPLARLRASSALQDCLAAIAVANGSGALTVESVDYARYAEKPALIVVFTADNGRFAWASGPDCGAPGLGADRLDVVPVG